MFRGIVGRITNRPQSVNVTWVFSPKNVALWGIDGKQLGISEARVRRIWRSHGCLKPPRVENFRISNDPELAE